MRGLRGGAGAGRSSGLFWGAEVTGRRRRGKGQVGGSRWQASAPTAPPVLPARSRPSASTPETWAKFTQENLHRAERERLASVNLRVLIDCILRDTAEDLRLQRDAVNLAFERRCEELEDTLHKLEQHLHKVGPPLPPGPRPRRATVWAPLTTERDQAGPLWPVAPLGTTWSRPGLAPAPCPSGGTPEAGQPPSALPLPSLSWREAG